MALPSLPTELLLKILSYLAPATIERLARTFNKHIYQICLPLLRDHLATQQNAKRMVSQFFYRPNHYKRPDWMDNSISKIWSRYKLQRKWGPFDLPPPYNDQNPSPCLDHLNLHGEFDWLAPFEATLELDCFPFVHCHRFTTPKQITLLKTQAENLGLKYPTGFFDFIRLMEEDYHVRSPPGDFFE